MARLRSLAAWKAPRRHDPPGFILTATAATLAVFWLAHVYADVLEHELGQAGFDLKVVPSVMARELSMVAAPALSILFLLLGVLGLLDEGLAVGLALWTGVAQLVGWAIEAGGRPRAEDRAAGRAGQLVVWLPGGVGLRSGGSVRGSWRGVSVAVGWCRLGSQAHLGPRINPESRSSGDMMIDWLSPPGGEGGRSVFAGHPLEPRPAGPWRSDSSVAGAGRVRIGLVAPAACTMPA